jgi:hypothetical protein
VRLRVGVRDGEVVASAVLVDVGDRVDGGSVLVSLGDAEPVVLADGVAVPLEEGAPVRLEDFALKRDAATVRLEVPVWLREGVPVALEEAVPVALNDGTAVQLAEGVPVALSDDVGVGDGGYAETYTRATAAVGPVNSEPNVVSAYHPKPPGDSSHWPVAGVTLPPTPSATLTPM